MMVVWPLEVPVWPVVPEVLEWDPAVPEVLELEPMVTVMLVGVEVNAISS